MTKFRLLAPLMSLIISSSAFASQQFECVKTSDGAITKIGSKTLGFSSLDQCNGQLEYLATGPANAVICGCNANPAPGGTFLALMGAMMGIAQTVMTLECYKIVGAEFVPVEYKNYEVIRETNMSNKKGKAITFYKEKVEACKKEEHRLFVQLNNISAIAESRY